MTVDMSQFYQSFFEESFEGLDVMESELLNLDVGEADSEVINTIFRAAHSIKGGSATFGFDAVANFTHVVETLLDEMRDGVRQVTQESVDLFLQSVDCMRAMLKAVQSGDEIDSETVVKLQDRLTTMLNGGASEAPAQAEASAPAAVQPASVSGWRITFKPFDHLLRTGNDPVRMFNELAALGDLTATVIDEGLPAFADIDPEVCYLGWTLELLANISREQVEEVFEWVDGDCELHIEPIGAVAEAATTISAEAEAEDSSEHEEPAVDSAPMVGEQGGPAVAAAPEKSSPQEKKKTAANAEQGSIRVSIDKVDALINMVGELVITQSMLGQIGDNLDVAHIEKLQDGLALLERNTRELQESVMRIRMLPISFAFQRFPRMVRDVSQKLGKSVELKLSGEQTELDKTVMEKIGDPLVHLVRNSVDHGIEMPEARLAAGKPETGTVHLNAYHQGGNIVIEINDDGAGLNAEKILAKARERGLVGVDEEPGEERIYELVFEPGFSTADEVSDLSGRGVGMDVVKRNIKALGGTIDVSSTKGQGSTFTIRLPLTLAILDGQLVRVGKETYIVPLVSIVESLQIYPKSLKAVAGQTELYMVRGEYIPIVRMHEVFEIESENTDLSSGLLVVVEGDGVRAGLFVDELLGQQQVVIKSLETNFRKVEGVSGATILGDGTVALILDIGGVIRISREPNGSPGRKRQLPAMEEPCSDEENVADTAGDQNEAA